MTMTLESIVAMLLELEQLEEEMDALEAEATELNATDESSLEDRRRHLKLEEAFLAKCRRVNELGSAAGLPPLGNVSSEISQRMERLRRQITVDETGCDGSS
jgi:hypothetical protein